MTRSVRRRIKPLRGPVYRPFATALLQYERWGRSVDAKDEDGARRGGDVLRGLEAAGADDVTVVDCMVVERGYEGCVVSTVIDDRSAASSGLPKGPIFWIWNTASISFSGCR